MDNYKKVGRDTKYLLGMIDLPLRLQGDGSGMIKWYLDTFYAVYPAMKGCTHRNMDVNQTEVGSP